MATLKSPEAVDDNRLMAKSPDAMELMPARLSDPEAFPPVNATDPLPEAVAN